jgi:hypothetical protein
MNKLLPLLNFPLSINPYPFYWMSGFSGVTDVV